MTIPGKIWMRDTYIAAQIKEMAEVINADYFDADPLLLVLTNGGMVFAADLIRHLQFPLEMEALPVSSYVDNVSGPRVLMKAPLPKMKGRYVLIIDDVIDVGNTIDRISRACTNVGEAASVSFAVFAAKPCLRLHISHITHRATFMPQGMTGYYGAQFPDRFLFGYGMDYSGKFRNLPHVYVPNDQLDPKRPA